MQQLLKHLEDDHYVSKYRVCEDKVTVRGIFWSHPDSIKLFNTFSTVLIIDSTYKTNKYIFSLLEIGGVTYTEMTYSADFAFLESEKRTMLHEFGNVQDYVKRPREHATSISHQS